MAMSGNPIGWFEIYVQDMARARAFYESVFQIALTPLNTPLEMLSFPSDMKRYGAGGALVRMAGFASGGGGTLVYFSCLDCALEESRVTIYGGRIQRAKMSIGEYGFVSLAIDSEGNMIGLHSMK